MERQSSNWSFVDLSFLLALSLLLMLFLAIVNIVQIKIQNKDIDTNAEYIIALTWQNGADLDVDVWVRDPQENLLFFRSKEVGIMHLDRDDLGNTNDTYEEGGVVKIAPTNQEIVTIRGFMEGEWVVNTHLYRIGDPSTPQAKCHLAITKLNPSAEIVANKYFTLDEYWEEKTVARFLMTTNGESFLQETLPIKFVESKVAMPQAGYDTYR